jgi:hypothetical protein
MLENILCTKFKSSAVTIYNMVGYKEKIDILKINFVLFI